MNITPIIQLQSVSKTYNNQCVIDNLNLNIYPGQSVGLLGVNGAGKTTLLKLILGLENPTSGKVLLNSLSPHNSKARSTIGVVPQTSNFIDELTTRETLQFISKHYHESLPISHLIEAFSLHSFMSKRVKILSEGQKKRLSLALAFVGKPKIVFLDEPTVGLDIQSRLSLWEFIKSYHKSDTTIILTTHYLEEAETLANYFVFLHKGKITIEGASNTIYKNISKTNLFFKLSNHAPWLENYPDLIKHDDNNYQLQILDSDSFIRDMVHNNVPFYDLHIQKNSLKDSFIKITQD